MRKGYEGINALTVLIIGIMVLSICGLGYYLFVSNQIAFFNLLPNFNSSKTQADKVQIIGYEIGTDHLQYYDAGGKWMNFPLDADKSFEKESGGYSMNFGDKVVMYKPTWEALRDYYYNSERGIKSLGVNNQQVNIESFPNPGNPPIQDYDQVIKDSLKAGTSDTNIIYGVIYPYLKYYSQDCFVMAEQEESQLDMISIFYPKEAKCISGGIRFAYTYNENGKMVSRSFVLGADNNYYLQSGEYEAIDMPGLRYFWDVYLKKKDTPLWKENVYRYSPLTADRTFNLNDKEVSGNDILLQTKEAFEAVKGWRDSVLSKPVTLSYIDVKQKSTVKQNYCVKKVRNILTVDLTVPSNGAQCQVVSR
jgi:hypothetical protein